MFVETDLRKIKRIARQQVEENLRFRSYLKNCDSEKLDSAVHELYAEVAPQIDCKECSNCCREVSPVFTREDIGRFAGGINLTAVDFSDRYLAQEENDFIFNKRPCPFLKNNLCSEYELRPEDCRSFPHLHKSDIKYRLFNLIHNTEICPIVFNVFESLKCEVWNNPYYGDFDDDYLDW